MTDSPENPKDEVTQDKPDDSFPDTMDSLDDIDVEGDDLNRTMVAMEMSDVQLDNATRTNIKIPNVDGEQDEDEGTDMSAGASQQNASGWGQTFLNKVSLDAVRGLFSSKKGLLRGLKNPVPALPALSLVHKLIYFFIRFAFWGSSLWLVSVLWQHYLSSQGTGHPAQMLVFAAALVGTGLVILTAVKRWSAVWALNGPILALSFLVTTAFLFFDPYDPDFLSWYGAPVDGWLLYFLAGVVGVMMVFTLCFELSSKKARFFMGGFFLIWLALLLVPTSEGMGVSESLYGYGAFSTLTHFSFQPSYLIMHGLFELLAIVFLLLALRKLDRSVMGFRVAAAFSVQCLFLSFIGLAVLQNQRLFHALNIFWPQKLHVGAVELNVDRQNLRIETANFQATGGGDDQLRYKMAVKRGKKPNEFILTVKNSQGFPVQGLSKKGFGIFLDKEPLKKFRFKELTGKKNQGTYRLGIQLKKDTKMLQWGQSKRNYLNYESLKFQIANLKQVNKLVVTHNEDVLWELEKPKIEHLKFPLSYFQPGKYDLHFALYDDAEHVLYEETRSIEVVSRPELYVVSPQDGDVFLDNVPVVLYTQALDGSSIESVDYTINGKKVSQAKGFSYYHVLDITGFQERDLQIEVVVHQKNKQTLNNRVLVRKTLAPPRLKLTSPQMGEYALRQTAVKFHLDQTSSQLAAVKVLINGIPFEDFSINDQEFLLPVLRWDYPELFVTVQAVLESGERVSDWVQVNKGIGVLDIEFDMPTLKFINYKNVAIVFDASLSNQDVWSGRSKWDVMNRIVVDRDLSEQLKQVRPSFFVYGAKKSHHYADCEDVQSLMKGAQYNSTILKRKMSDLQPKGVSALSAVLKKAFKSKPDKIIMFADSVGSCSKGIVADVKELKKKSPDTKLVVFSLGTVSERDRKLFKRLAKASGGVWHQPDEYDRLVDLMKSEMSLNYELHSQGDLVFRSILENKKIHLDPGPYTLKIPQASRVHELNFDLQNGQKVNFKVSGKTGKIHVLQSEIKL